MVIALALVMVERFFSDRHQKSVPRAPESHPVSAPAGFRTSAPISGSPYTGYPEYEFRRWLFEYLDQHPDRELAARLKGYFESGRAELGFESTMYSAIKREGKAFSPIVRLRQGNDPSVPKMIFDTLIFDRRYTTVQMAFRLLQHEGGHIDRVFSGELPLRLIIGTSQQPISRDDVRLMYEDEVKAHRGECEFARGKPDYLDKNGAEPDFCLEYWRSDVQSIRDMIARTYPKVSENYKQHREYVLRLAKDPNAR